MVEADIEHETEWAINRVLADAIKEDMVERFKGRYDLSDLLGYVERGLEQEPRASWRLVLRGRIGDQGLNLRDEIEDAVREYLPDDDE
jgi:hypothetical protein